MPVYMSQKHQKDRPEDSDVDYLQGPAENAVERIGNENIFPSIRIKKKLVWTFKSILPLETYIIYV